MEIRDRLIRMAKNLLAICGLVIMLILIAGAALTSDPQVEVRNLLWAILLAVLVARFAPEDRQ